MLCEGHVHLKRGKSSTANAEIDGILKSIFLSHEGEEMSKK